MPQELEQGRVTDVSQLYTDLAKCRVAQEFRETIINTITDNLIVIDPSDCRIVLANESFLASMGREAEAVLDRPCFEVMHGKEEHCHEEGFFCPVQESARLRRPVLTDKPGSCFWATSTDGQQASLCQMNASATHPAGCEKLHGQTAGHTPPAVRHPRLCAGGRRAYAFGSSLASRVRQQQARYSAPAIRIGAVKRNAQYNMSVPDPRHTSAIVTIAPATAITPPTSSQRQAMSRPTSPTAKPISSRTTAPNATIPNNL